MKLGSLFNSFLLIAFTLFGYSCFANYGNNVDDLYISEEVRFEEEDLDIHSESNELSAEFYVDGDDDKPSQSKTPYRSKILKNNPFIGTHCAARIRSKSGHHSSVQLPFYILFCSLKIAA